MRRFIIILFVVASACPASCQIIGTEYFIDKDPGYNAATYFSVAQGMYVSQLLTVALSSVPQGYHVLGYRAKDAQGHWSITTLYPFYAVPATPTGIVANEYFLDTDPGNGNANSIPVAVDSNNALHYMVPLSNYTAGFHIMGLRSEDNKGSWSHTLLYGFYINESNTPVNITALKYYFTSSRSTTDVYTYQVPVPSTNVSLNFNVNLSQLISNQAYDMHIWAINEKGVNSEVLIYHLASTVLPVTATLLTGVLNSNLTSSLGWTTLTETNNKGFDIERNEGSGWNTIGFVNGHGNSNTRIQYSFTDDNIFSGKQYLYRYKQLDFDNRFTYSNTVSINVPDRTNNLSIQLAPNPFYSKTTIGYTIPANGNITIELFDFSGKEIATILHKYQQVGSYKIALDASAFRLPSGMYYVRLSSEKASMESKIILIK